MAPTCDRVSSSRNPFDEAVFHEVSHLRCKCRVGREISDMLRRNISFPKKIKMSEKLGSECIAEVTPDFHTFISSHVVSNHIFEVTL